MGNTPQDRWQKENMVQISFRFAKKRDAAVIEKLKSVENKADYIRSLILNDIKKEA